MIEEDYNDWSHEKCDTCYRLLQQFDQFNKDDKLPTKWICVGRINKPDNPQDDHEEHNEFRVCIHNKDNPFSVDWTPYELNCAAGAMFIALQDFLIEFQPHHEIDEPLQNGRSVKDEM